MRVLIILILSIFTISTTAQYSMSNQTVYDCEGTLSDSEANSQQAGWYDHNENFTFTICPNGASSIIIDFSFFNTEPINDYLLIYDGPNTASPILAGPFSGVNTPPQITSSGCVTIVFVSDLNVAADGFNLSWETIITVPDPPQLSLANTPNCSTDVIELILDKNIHCDSVFTANISVSGQLNQIVNAIPLACLNDSTNIIQLNLNPGFNQSGTYNIFFQSYFKDVCDSIWSLSSSLSFDILDCPLIVDIVADDDTICLGDCIDLNVIVSGGDASSYNYSWIPILPNNSGPHQVCPTTTVQYIVSVSDLGPANSQSDTVTLVVVPPTTTQADFSICNTDAPLSLIASPIGGWWSGNSIVNGSNPIFDPTILSPGLYSLNYDINGCNDNLDITVLEINAGTDISACTNAPIFNLNSSLTTAGGIWSGNNIQANGDIDVGPFSTVIEAVYTLSNGCSDTLLVNVVNSISMPNNLSLCQNSNDTILFASPSGGTWSTIGNNVLIPSSCLNSIDDFPYVESFELGLSNWTNDVTNDFDWITNTNGTPSNNTGPSQAYDGNSYIYTESSNANFPFKNSSIISPCVNLSEYDNPVLNFSYHKYGNGNENALLSIDISMDNGTTWQLDVWSTIGDLGDNWFNQSIDLSTYNSNELKIRFRVLTGNHWSSDIAIDKVSILGGAISSNGILLSNVANSGSHTYTYSIEGCSSNFTVYYQEINAGGDLEICPSQSPFNLVGSPPGGVWNGINIINNNNGLYDPINLGIDIITYSNSSCIDTVLINVIDTDIFDDSLFLCHNSPNQYLDLDVVSREPTNGIWTGLGITDPNFPGIFNPNISGSGSHIINYTANSCTDNLIIQVYPKPILFDSIICSNSTPFVLNINSSGGIFSGVGIIDNTIGLIDPSLMTLGVNYLQYTSLNGCVDTFEVNIINPPIVSFNSLIIDYCFVDSLYTVSTSPSGGVLSGNGIANFSFNPSIAGPGYHNISFTYGSGNCIATIDTVFFVADELVTTTSVSDDTICAGELLTISASSVGGTGNYQFDWNNNLSNSFSHLISPTQTTEYILSVSDGCSDSTIDTLQIFVFDTFNLNFSTSEKKCFGEVGYAKVFSNSNNVQYQWNTNPISFGDSIIGTVDRNYIVLATNTLTNCIIYDTVRIQGFSNLSSQFSLNVNDCVSILDANIQLIDLSIVNYNEISSDSYWDFGDGTKIPYVYSINPTHTYVDTGQFQLSLFLINDGGCIDSSSLSVCVASDNKFFIPNSFTPDNDNCNDLFFIKALGLFSDFNIKIYDRWTSALIFESNEILLTNNMLENSSCDNNTIGDYYKLGSWDGRMLNGIKAPLGAYVYEVSYREKKDSEITKLLGSITLIR